MTAATIDPMMLDHALDLAGLGWQVFPCRPTGPKAKAPLTEHGHLEATTDPDQIRAWWSRWPDAMIGAPVPAALLVLDIDPRHGGDVGIAQLEADHGALPATLTTISGRGDGGKHLYFRRPAGAVTSTRLPKGIDLKAAGYCVVPPSLHPDTGRPYQWIDADPVALPEWLRDVLRPAPVRLRSVTTSSGDGRHLVEFVARQPEGNRNKALHWAAHRAIENGLLDGIEVDLIAAAVAAGESEGVAKLTVESARKKVGA